MLADVVPHLQCSAGLHHPIIFKLSVKGAGQRLTTAKESSRSDGEKERERAGGKVSEAVSECSGAPGLSLQQSFYISPLLSLLPSLHSAPCCPLAFPPLLFCLPPPSSAISAFQSSARIALSAALPLYFSLSILLPFLLWFSITFFFPLGGWSESFFFFLTPALSPVLFPCITSHGHPCILQVRAGCVCVCEGVWAGLTATDS